MKSYFQIPYYIDGDVKITQSNAILRHLARKYNLMGQTEEEQIRIDILENQITDCNNTLYQLVYERNPKCL